MKKITLLFFVFYIFCTNSIGKENFFIDKTANKLTAFLIKNMELDHRQIIELKKINKETVYEADFIKAQNVNDSTKAKQIKNLAIKKEVRIKSILNKKQFQNYIRLKNLLLKSTK